MGGAKIASQSQPVVVPPADLLGPVQVPVGQREERVAERGAGVDGAVGAVEVDLGEEPGAAVGVDAAVVVAGGVPFHEDVADVPDEQGPGGGAFRGLLARGAGGRRSRRPRRAFRRRLSPWPPPWSPPWSPPAHAMWSAWKFTWSSAKVAIVK